MSRIAVAFAVLLIVGCSAESEQPGGVSADEARQLNEAASMLDANSVSAEALGDAPDGR